MLCFSTFASAAEAPQDAAIESPQKQPSQLERELDSEAATMAAGGPYYPPPPKPGTDETPAEPPSPPPVEQPPAPAPLPQPPAAAAEPLKESVPAPDVPVSPPEPPSSQETAQLPTPSPALGMATETFPLPDPEPSNKSGSNEKTEKTAETVQQEEPSHDPLKRIRLVEGEKEALDVEHVGKKWQDISYGTASAKQKMDIYLPETGKGPFPVIVALHDLGGDKRDTEMSGPLMALSHGYAVACINYREAADARFPADVMDAKAAVRFLKGNASKYRLDASHIAAWGSSFGGKLAAFLGTTSGHPELEDPSIGARGQSSRVSAVVAFFPSLDETCMDADFQTLGIKPALPRNAESYGMEMYGVPVQRIPNLVAFHDPTRYIASDASPTFLLHGTADDVCPITQSNRFYDKMKHTIGSKNVEFVSVKGAGHHASDFLTKENLKKIFKFLDKKMKPKKREKK